MGTCVARSSCILSGSSVPLLHARAGSPPEIRVPGTYQGHTARQRQRAQLVPRLKHQRRPGMGLLPCLTALVRALLAAAQVAILTSRFAAPIRNTGS